MEILTIPAIVAIVEAIKRAGMPTAWAPLVSIILGCIIGFFFIDSGLVDKLGIGLVVGLSASGLYSSGMGLKKAVMK